MMCVRFSLSLRNVEDLLHERRIDISHEMVRYSAQQLTYHTIAPNAARRLLRAGRPEDALWIMETCIASEGGRNRAFDTPEVDSAHFACLEALGKEDNLRSAMWARFKTQLCAETLRRYLTRLPDFDDDEALLNARTHVRIHPDLLQGLIFCVSWPDAGLAADLILSRHAELDGNIYDVLTPTSELLRAEHPLAATLIWRSMITFAIQNNRAKRYRHAARHIIEKFPFRIREVRTDNGHEFQAKFHWHVEDLGIRHAYIKRGTPQLNGKVERSHRSDQQEFYQLLSYKGDVDLEAKLDEWERFYNFARPHGAHNGQTPYEALRDKLQ